MAGVPFVFGNATTSIPLSNLDADFNTPVTIGNTTVGLGNTVTTLGNVTLTNVNIVSGTVPTANSIVNGTSNVVIASSGGAVNISTNGTQAITVDTSQNVGIGTSSPTGKLDVSGFVRAINYLPVPTTGTGVEMYYVPAATQGYIGAYDRAAAQYRPLEINGSQLVFGTSTAGAEAMRIDSSGNLLVGKTTSNPTVGNGFQCSPAGAINVVTAATTAAFDTYEIYSTGAAAYRFYVTAAGQVYATSIVITAISDQRLKENIRDIDVGLDAVMALKPRRFDWKDGKGQDKKNVAGFIAQEFETVFPECVSLTKAGGDGIEYKNINHETLIPTLVKAIQELNAKVTALETQLGVK